MWTVLVLANSAYGWEAFYDTEGEPVAWGSMPIYYEVDTSNAPSGLDAAGQVDAIDASAEAWTGIDDAEVSIVNQENVQQVPNLIYWEPNWQWDASTLALTTTTATTSGTLLAFEIKINGEAEWALEGGGDGHDLQNTMTHEFGHMLGFDHAVADKATMYAAAEPGETAKRDLFWDDEDAARFVYPIGGSGGGGLLESTGCNASGTAPALGTLIIGLLAVFRRTRRHGALLAALFATVLLSSPALAGAPPFETIPELKALAETSTHVVRGEVVAAVAERDGDQLVTRYTIAVDETLQGDDQEEIELVLPGGQLDDIVMRVSSVPLWEVGDHAVVFVPEDGPIRFDGLFTVDPGLNMGVRHGHSKPVTISGPPMTGSVAASGFSPTMMVLFGLVVLAVLAAAYPVWRSLQAKGRI